MIMSWKNNILIIINVSVFKLFVLSKENNKIIQFNSILIANLCEFLGHYMIISWKNNIL